MSHICETDEGWRPCPADLCEGLTLFERVKEIERRLASEQEAHDRERDLLAQRIAELEAKLGERPHGYLVGHYPE